MFNTYNAKRRAETFIRRYRKNKNPCPRTVAGNLRNHQNVEY